MTPESALALAGMFYLLFKQHEDDSNPVLATLFLIASLLWTAITFVRLF